jgi:IS5 family transposase
MLNHKIHFSLPSRQAGRLEKLKASVCAKVEHPFRYINRVFGYHKVCYRKLHKNTQRLYLLAGLMNLFIAEKYMTA